jgi:hypothetical protein
VGTWCFTFRPDGGRRPLTDVEADYLEHERSGPHMVLWRTQLVVGRPQRVIVWRLRRDEATVERLCQAATNGSTKKFCREMASLVDTSTPGH